MVSCKAAIYSLDGKYVLLMRYPQLGPKAHGLPGGHLEQGENPDEAVLREIGEELGTNLAISLKRTDFWPHENGKIVLGYVGRGSFDLPPAPDPTFEFAVWATKSDLQSGNVSAGSYTSFVISNWPKVVE